MFHVGYLYVEQILELLGNTEVFHHPLALCAEEAINSQGGLCVDAGHLEVVF